MTVTEDFIAEVRGEVDETLGKLLPAADVAPANLHEAIRWSIFAGGKRVRPMIVIAAGETFGASRERLLRTAAAIEMVHTYSLIHDDLPAMDDDDLRRGKAACHKQFGEATAILAGDVLQTLAFKTIADDDALPAETRLRIISLLADAAGTPAGMVSGQQLDLAAEGKTLAIADIEQIHRQKTGALITASAVAGAIIGGAEEDELAAMREYGANLGLLFQITDDLLDATAATEKLGKTAGKDAASEKATYTGHYGVEHSSVIASEIHEAACKSLGRIGKDTSLLRQLAAAIAGRTR
jgi:geranylgeranyl pyrophosphate synthase